MMIEEIQSSIVTTAFKYLQEKGQELKGFGLSLEDLELALHALRRVYKPENQRRMELAKLLFEEFKKRTDSDEEISEKVGFANHALKHYICILSRCGESLAAREVLLRHEKYSPVHHQASKWQDVRNGFAKEKNEEELRRTTDYMQERGIIHKSHKLEVNIQSCIGMDDLRGAKKWYVCCIDAGIPLAIRTSCSILKLCILRGDLGWGQPIIEEILERPDKEAWDIIFQWAAVKGRGVEEIERMMEVMVRRNQERSNDERPDIDTINGLVELANRANDSYTAERYIALAQNWSIPLNGRTFLLQFDYRLKTGDIHGARSAYTQLQAHEAPEKEDIQLANKLILALCKAKRPDYAMIMQHVEDLSERNARFEPEVVSALCQIHLARNELHDVIDLLKTHTFHYDMQERNSIRKIFVKFCLDRSNNTSSAWDVYSIARQIFNEMDINTRIKLMDEFFARKRSDMGIHVFGHMRQQSVKRGRPNTEAYARCFEGIAKNEDYESLEIVHNMLKLDSEVEPDTRVYNGLMLAYTACGEPYRGLEFWDDIQYSQEGPTYNSICIAFRACELSPHGDQQAREIWSKLQKFEIEVTKDIYDAYVGALAGHGLGKEVISLINQMKEEIGCPPDVSTWVYIS